MKCFQSEIVFYSFTIWMLTLANCI